MNNMRYPQHIAIIADGNRTRAKEQWLTGMDGHFAGAKRTLELLPYIFSTTDIKVVTWWFLSTENLKERSPEEVAFIFSTLKMLGNDIDAFLTEHSVNFRWVWNRTWLPEDIIAFLDEKQKKFSFPQSDKTTVFAINYWWRDEIIRWIQALSQEQITALTEDTFSTILDFGGLPPLELVIRTKWEVAHRTSGFMSWWIGYAELYFAKEFYPAFTNEKLDAALAWFDAVSENRNYWK